MAAAVVERVPCGRTTHEIHWRGNCPTLLGHLGDPLTEAVLHALGDPGRCGRRVEEWRDSGVDDVEWVLRRVRPEAGEAGAPEPAAALAWRAVVRSPDQQRAIGRGIAVGRAVRLVRRGVPGPFLAGVSELSLSDSQIRAWYAAGATAAEVRSLHRVGAGIDALHPDRRWTCPRCGTVVLARNAARHFRGTECYWFHGGALADGWIRGEPWLSFPLEAWGSGSSCRCTRAVAVQGILEHRRVANPHGMAGVESTFVRSFVRGVHARDVFVAIHSYAALEHVTLVTAARHLSDLRPTRIADYAALAASAQEASPLQATGTVEAS